MRDSLSILCDADISYEQRARAEYELTNDNRLLREYEESKNSIVGETLQEILDDRGLTPRDLGMEESQVSDILNERRLVSDADAEALERALGIDKSFWLNLQRQNPHWGLWGL
jgi:plasmid maintenance system antidote protein VapI